MSWALFTRYKSNNQSYLTFLFKRIYVNLIRPRFWIRWKGLEWQVSKKFHASKIPYYYGVADIEEFSFLEYILQPGDVFVDIGSNVGIYSSFVVKTLQTYCVLFEPDQEALAFNKEIQKRNFIEEYIDSFPYACSDESGVQQFTAGKDLNNTLTIHQNDKHVQVRCVRLDDVLTMSPTVIKIDAEGHDAHILRGAKNSLSKNTLKAVIVEFDNNKSEITTQLESAGFIQIQFLVESHIILQKEHVTHSGNAIFIKKDLYLRLGSSA